ncbi:hypothetical protein Tco_0779374 [Tanacetum coccineum]
MQRKHNKTSTREKANNLNLHKACTCKKAHINQPAPAKQPTSLLKRTLQVVFPQGNVRKGKIQFDILDEEEDIQQETKPQGEGDDPILELAKKLSLDSLQEKGKGEGKDPDFELAVKVSLDSFQAQRQAPVGGVADPVILLLRKIQKLPRYDTSEKIVHESSSTTDSERIESGTEATTPKVDKEQGEEASTTVTSEERMVVHAEDQAGSDPGKGNESTKDQAGPDPGESHAALVDQSLSPHYDSSYGLP